MTTVYVKADVYIRKEDVGQIVWGPTHDGKYLVQIKRPQFSCFVNMRDLAAWLWPTGPSCIHCQGRGYNWVDVGDGEVEKEGCEVCTHGHHPHMLGQCITWDDAKRISADGP